MSRYNNVIKLLECTQEYNLEELVELLLDEDEPTEDLAEDLAFVLISLGAMVPKDKWWSFKDRLTTEIVNVEVKEMYYNEGIKDSNCKNCGGAMWWEPDNGWFHHHPFCQDPEPFLGE